MSSTLFKPALLFSALFPLSQAVQAAHQAESRDTLIVSASATGIEAEKLGRAHSLISGAQLQRQQIRYVADALRQLPGLAVSRTGGPGGLTQIRVRGSEANHVLVLIDGIEASDAGQGEYDFSGLQVSNIERIEVLRGPQSAFWGSNATAGVINIVTREGVAGEPQLSLNSELGSDQTRQLGLGLNGGSERLQYNLSGSLRRSDGYNISDFGTEDDGDINRTLQAKLRLALSERLSLKFNSRYVNRDSDTDDQDFAFPATATQGRVIDTDSGAASEEWINAVALEWQGDLLRQQLQLEQSDNDRRGRSGSGDYGSDSRRQKAAYRISYDFDSDNATHTLTAGVEHEREQFENLLPSSPDQAGSRKRSLDGYVLQYQGEFAERLFLTASARQDDNDRFEDASTYSLSAAYQLANEVRLHGSLGSGVTNPTVYEQFGFFPGRYQGNPDLKPEQNRGWDLGIALPLWNSDSSLDITWFEERLEHEIITVYDSSFIGSPANSEGKSRRQGLELALQAELTRTLSARASYTNLISQQADGQLEVRRPRQSGALGLDYSTGDGRSRLFLDAVYNGSMQDSEFINATPETRVKLKHYWRLNLGADYQLNPQWQLYGRIENLLDRQYEEVFDYNVQGRTFFVGLRAQF
ncbi:TonB-dependent receptor plug domain-containing protein [Marinobacterium jannaschii]|uniref:TonB-dependent receptor plug domain-containing protein n=1 Tax=Marinobacterium jannaschii TaxID=64970 RepID=UPI00068793A3|nr:TonB-dependent receptor [Marinobacterium jannaschii]